MSLYTPQQRAIAKAIGRFNYVNPFTPERITLEREILGDAFVAAPDVWSLRLDQVDRNPNLHTLGTIACELAEQGARALAKEKKPSAQDLELHQDVVIYALYHTFRNELNALLSQTGDSPRITVYDQVKEAALRLLAGHACPLTDEFPHLFALFFQIHRAFHHIYTAIIGGSLCSASLRARVWESIFTHDMRRYRRVLYSCLGDIPTLITGPTGTGKELVAQSVGRCRYIPFDPDTRTFAVSYTTCFRAVNLSALSPTLIESELFGHRRGAFTGAQEDKVGWLEACGPLDTVFLDEIGDLDASIQVKLLRVLQTRSFQRLGETVDRRFKGKIVAATHCDLAAKMQDGSFRTDFYYRLCADQIRTSSLADIIGDKPEELRQLVRVLARRVIGDAEEPLLTQQVMAYINNEISPTYAWPGNVRELEQCIRNIMIHGDYRPATDGRTQALEAALATGQLTADELTQWYCTTVYNLTGSYQETARRLDLDRRTVKAKVNPDILTRINDQPSP